jgi:hypothetical protein
MTTDLAERRKGRALTLFLIAGVLAAAAAVTVAIESRASRPDLASGPVVPGLEDTIGDAQRVIITSREASYRIERVERGAERVWVMRDRGDFPVAASRLQQLTQGLEGLRYLRRMTSDPEKHERLGVTDPRQGGRGVLVQVEDGRGALLVNLILGVEPAGLYVRRPDDNQTWAARGELPPFRDVASWLELRPLTLAADRLARVEIVPAQGRAYILARDDATQPWRIAAPALAPLSQSAVAAAAERLTQLSPIDVQLAPAIQGPARARVRATTFDGVLIDGELIPSDGKVWLKLVARANAPEQDAAALEINNHSSDWAFALSDTEAEALAPPLTSLIPGAE